MGQRERPPKSAAGWRISPDAVCLPWHPLSICPVLPLCGFRMFSIVSAVSARPYIESLGWEATASRIVPHCGASLADCGGGVCEKKSVATGKLLDQAKRLKKKGKCAGLAGLRLSGLSGFIRTIRHRFDARYCLGRMIAWALGRARGRCWRMGFGFQRACARVCPGRFLFPTSRRSSPRDLIIGIAVAKTNHGKKTRGGGRV